MMRFTAAAMVTAVLVGTVPAGDLEPAEAPAPTPGPEPRIAINEVNTPGDSNSVYRITEPGSYYLEDDINASVLSDLHGIFIAASDVTVDLNGFRIRRGVIIIGPFDPEPQGGGPLVSGIRASNEVKSIRILNGHVTGWSDDGIRLFGVDGCSVIDVTAHDNTDNGIQAGSAANIMNCIAESNGGIGIVVSLGSSVRGCVSRNNGGSGISTGEGSVVTDCAADNNGFVGIACNDNSTVGNCSARGNDGTGIQVVNRGHIHNSHAGENGSSGIRSAADGHIESCTAIDNAGTGIFTTGGGMIANCSSSGNDANGFEVSFSEANVVNNNANENDLAGIEISGSGCRIDGNYMSDNGTGLLVTGANNVITRNVASANDTDYTIGAGNDFATIQTSVNSAGPWDNVER